MKENAYILAHYLKNSKSETWLLSLCIKTKLGRRWKTTILEKNGEVLIQNRNWTEAVAIPLYNTLPMYVLAHKGITDKYTEIVDNVWGFSAIQTKNIIWKGTIKESRKKFNQIILDKYEELKK